MSLLCLLLLALLLVDILIVVLSYSMCWYEYANSNPQLMEVRFKPRSLWLALSLIGQEFFFNLVTLLLFPFGLWPSRHQPQAGGKTPILLLHGLFINRACWLWFKWALKRRGFDTLVTINLSSYHNVEALTEQVAKRIDSLRHSLNVEKVHLVGHSMGGIIARNYLQLRGGEGKVDRCICLGTPHAGSKLTPFTFTPLSRVLLPGSELLTRLAEAPPPQQARIFNIYSRMDNMVVPATSAHLEWLDNKVIERIGHTGMLYRRRSIQSVADALGASEDDR